MKEITRLVVGLAITCAVASAVLALANAVTLEARKAAEKRELDTALGLVLPAAGGGTVGEGVETTVTAAGGGQAMTVTFYPLRGDRGVTAVAGKGKATGFGGELNVLVGIDAASGTITKVLVMPGHKETPGLGTEATDRKRRRSLWQVLGGADGDTGLPPNRYLDDYEGMRVADVAADAFRVVKRASEIRTDSAGQPLDVMAVTGATISSKAVGTAVSRVCRAYVDHRDAL